MNKPLPPSVGDVPTHTLPLDTMAQPLGGPSPRPTVPGFELIELLGQGGMGVVWKARQTKLNRLVALKLAAGNRPVEPKDLIRFLAEAEAVAAVKHAHVVQVYEYGESEGRPFLAMEYLPGGTFTPNGDDPPSPTGTGSQASFRLAESFGSVPAPTKRLAATLAKIARGVAAAHEQGIVHRDLKPGNVLLDEHGEPKVTDFGLAKRSAQTDITATQAVMGTPSYMAPEQAEGHAKFVTPAADVWSLGVMLYEGLTGERPFRGPNVMAVLRAVTSDEPTRPRAVVATVPRDLELVCLKCLAKDPTERYPTAAEFATDLERFAAGEGVSVRPAGLVERAAKWARRKPTLATAWAFGVMAFFLAAVTTTVLTLWMKATNERDAAATARTEAVNARTQLEMVEYGATVQLAHSAVREDRIAPALALLGRTRPDLRRWEYGHVHFLCHEEKLQLVGHRKEVAWVLYSPDGRLLVTASWDQTARIWDAATGALIHELKGHRGNVVNVNFTPDGKRVVTASGDNTARLWDVASGACVAVLAGHTDFVWTIAASPNGRWIVTGSKDNTVRVWDARTGAFLRELPGHRNAVVAVAFDRSGERLVTGSWDQTARVWEPATGRLIAELGHFERVRTAARALAGTGTATLAGHTDQVRAAIVTADGTRVATVGSDNTARLWDAATGREVAVLRGHEGNVVDVRFRPGERELVTCCWDGTARVWDAATGAALAELKGHTGPALNADYSPDGRLLATSGHDGTVRVWNAETHKLLAVHRGHTWRAVTVRFSPDGQRLATASWDGTARVWDAAGGGAMVELNGHTQSVRAVAYSPDGTRLATASSDGTARLWNVRTGVDTVLKHGDTVTAVAFDPAGTVLATACEDGTARVWEAATGKLLRELPGHEDAVTAIAFSPDGKRLATASADKTARLWTVADGTSVALTGHAQGVIAVAFAVDGTLATASNDETARVWNADGAFRFELRGHTKNLVAIGFNPDGKQLATAGGDGTVRLWGPTTGKAGPVLTSPSGWVNGFAFRPDGRRIASADGDGTVRVWDVATGSLATELRGHTKKVYAVAFNRDGTRIVTGSEDRTARVWDTETGAAVAELLGHTGTLTAVRFSPNGTQIVTASMDGTARLWHSAARGER